MRITRMGKAKRLMTRKRRKMRMGRKERIRLSLLSRMPFVRFDSTAR